MADSTAIVIEPYPHKVEIKFDGDTLATTQRALLLTETYAPDIYIPFADINMQYMMRSDMRTHAHKGDACYWTIRSQNTSAINSMWAYKEPLPPCSAIEGYASFDFDNIETYVDAKLVRGHVRDPHKTIETEPLDGQLVLEFAGRTVVDTDACILLHESGLPSRYYVPIEHVATEHLVASPRQSVCTYKGEANYYHVNVGEAVAENAVWSYRTPWLDFSIDVGNISGLLAFYITAFDPVLLNGKPIELDESMLATDAHMRASPTIDQTLAMKLS